MAHTLIGRDGGEVQEEPANHVRFGSLAVSLAKVERLPHGLTGFAAPTASDQKVSEHHPARGMVLIEAAGLP